ncbi:hypothetical protein JCM19294_1619 [Nonlabens tegetincola]|uniref:Anti-sigma K factor RskA C-terminal domain-containing protein n=1 Tax=Nonlabens tegetincola TaxID=323273 RepID=A0A090Q752_9FLAO|nr:anti-sigma factor [Nonlabens tegetincola]GAK97997.1 hypothetical protein JCM19294_1619 [Nonlabens tegetincola]
MVENKNIQEFLESGVLDRYVMGKATEIEIQQAEHYIATFDEIKFAYDMMQIELQAQAFKTQENPPEDLKKELFSTINTSNKEIKKQDSISWFQIAVACIAAVGFVGMLYYMNIANEKTQRLEQLEGEFSSLENRIKNLESDNLIFDEEIQFLRSPKTQKYILKKDTSLGNLNVITYHNNKRSVVDVTSLPKLDKEHDYQLWADVNGEMISLAVLNQDFLEVDTKIIDEASSLNITIEKAGGSDHATVENLVVGLSI